MWPCFRVIQGLERPDLCRKLLSSTYNSLENSFTVFRKLELMVFTVQTVIYKPNNYKNTYLIMGVKISLFILLEMLSLWVKTTTTLFPLWHMLIISDKISRKMSFLCLIMPIVTIAMNWLFFNRLISLFPLFLLWENCSLVLDLLRAEDLYLFSGLLMIMDIV